MSTLVKSALYGLLVFGGTAVLGFVVAPALGAASGLFAIDTEAQAFFSLLTLKGTPYLVGLSALSAFFHPSLATRPFRSRAAWFGLNVVAAWLVAAGLSMAVLG